MTRWSPSLATLGQVILDAGFSGVHLHSVYRLGSASAMVDPVRDPRDLNVSTGGRLPWIAYNGLVRTSSLRRLPGIGALWQRAWATACDRWGEAVSTRLHGQDILLNFGNLYPITVRTVPTYNAPLIELVAQVSTALGRPVRIVDVGAAVGDSVLLLQQRCPGMVSRFDCFEGHDGFFRLLEHNVGGLPQTRLHHVIVSDAPGSERSLVQTHRATASMQGPGTVTATTVDLELPTAAVDILKIDTDGFDGKVLAGARELLARSLPSVIFEWHPLLCKATGNDDQLAFTTLAGIGYRTFAFFTKHGVFSHFVVDAEASRAELQALSDYCRTTTTRPDWHYDVVALPENTDVSPLLLADLAYATGGTRSPVE